MSCPRDELITREEVHEAIAMADDIDGATDAVMDLVEKAQNYVQEKTA